MGRVLRTAAGKKKANVILIYVRTSREDPNAGIAFDAFADAMEAIDRALWFTWPAGANTILAHLRGEPVTNAGRPLAAPAPTARSQSSEPRH